MGETNSQNLDAVRNVIRSHNTMLVSMPQEISMRAGLQRGVQVRVGQLDLASPHIITLEVINPVDRSAELKKLLEAQKAVADKRDAKAKRKADGEKKAAKAAKKKKVEAAKKAKADKKKAEDAAKKVEESEPTADEEAERAIQVAPEPQAEQPEVPPEKDNEYAVKW